MDTIPYVPRGELPSIPPGHGYRRPVDTTWMDDDVQPAAGDGGEWGA
ncbi:hypothetical protein [Microbacterium azadirachtae]|nr:hypothetical protein [Microbacterium azadirachtae]